MSDITKATDQNLTLTERLKLKRSCSVLLLDCSGSMNEDVEPGRSKASALRDIVSGLDQNHFFWFNSTFGECTKDTIPNPSGNTYLAALLNDIKSKGHRSVIILTDGDINDKFATLLARRSLAIKVMYIGAGQRPAFLDQLASAGNATTEDLKETKQLTNKIQLLLGSGAERKGAIEL